MKILAVAFALSLLLIPIRVPAQNAGRGRGSKVPPTPAPVKGILHASRFTLETPYQYTWTKERILVSTGVLVVLEVDPAYVVPRNALEPVLYAGNVPVHRLNHGNVSGRVIGIVPGNIDFATAPIWFGSPELPERITASMAASERARAEKAGVRPFPQAKLAGVERRAVTAKDLAALLRNVVAELVYQYSPQEKELAESWRLPVARAPSRKP
jgi:hypothetical protein